VAKEADNRTKQIQLKLLNSRKKLETQNPRKLQLDWSRLWQLLEGQLISRFQGRRRQKRVLTKLSSQEVLRRLSRWQNVLSLLLVPRRRKGLVAVPLRPLTRFQQVLLLLQKMPQEQYDQGYLLEDVSNAPPNDRQDLPRQPTEPKPTRRNSTTDKGNGPDKEKINKTTAAAKSTKARTNSTRRPIDSHQVD
jgi:hypothetical protein